jgi:hypothetical protein
VLAHAGRGSLRETEYDPVGRTTLERGDAIQTRMSPLLLGARNRAIAALQLADGRPADAGRRIEEGVAALRVFGFGGLAVFEQELFARLDEWKNTLEVPQPVAEPCAGESGVPRSTLTGGQ